MKTKIALIGFGTVGRGLCEILISKQNELKTKYGFDYSIVAISDLVKGSVFAENGLDVKECLHLIENDRSLNEYTAGPCLTGWDSLKTITHSNAEVICELTFTDVTSGEPANTHCRAALSSKKHVVTSNKGPAALFYNQLLSLAERNGVQFRIEGTVMSGTPVLNLIDGPLAGCRIEGFKGILNGTTNYILTEMEAGASFESVLKKAQELGYAEADPTGDVEGFDAMAKVIILANVIMDLQLKPEDIHRQGITQITPAKIEDAKEKNARWKLIGSVAINTKGDHTARVLPELVPLSHPLAGVSGATNALTFTTDLMGDVTIIGAGAGRIETGFSILNDILAIHRIKNHNDN
jgi:homoserine dehydrogenase